MIGYTYNMKLVRVVDGDTIVADVDLGFFASMRITFRLLGINAPEMNTPEGVAAKAALVNLLTPPPALQVKSVKTDKYGGRWDGDIWICNPAGDPTVRVNQWMLDHGFAVPYKG
jgi:endonuclease YncB( thermonuclease family)